MKELGGLLSAISLAPTRKTVGAACLAAAVWSMSPQVPAATVRTQSDMRLWETVHDRFAPLAWPWEDASDSATLVFSNRLTSAVETVDVARGPEEVRGSCVQPLQDRETIVDVSLVQKAGANEVARESATLAYVAGAGGGPITVRAAMQAPARVLAKVSKPRVYAFDPAWLGETGDSGYAVAWPLYRPLKIILR